MSFVGHSIVCLFAPGNHQA